MTTTFFQVIAMCVLCALLRVLSYAIHMNNVYHAEMEDIAMQQDIDAEYYGL